MIGAGPEQFFQQIDHIIKSHSLRGSESLCKLLQYLAKQSLDHPTAPLKEYQIATEVYGRHADFDPQSDSTIRVQAGRLRLKLAEYYATEGASDPVVVKLPKGSYHLTFEPKHVEPEPQGAILRPSLVPAPAAPVVPVQWRIAVIVLLSCLTASLVVLGSLLWTRNRADAASATSLSARPVAGPLAKFWRPFTAGGDDPWVIFSNAAFIGRPETGMRYYNPRQDSKTTVYDHYTGVGEVLAVHALDDVFSSLGHQIRVKRGSLFTLDDASNANLIFVGSPSENLSLLDIPGTREFVFQRMASGPRKGDLSIVSRHPKPDEASSYLASPSNAPLTEDYAVVGLVPGESPNRMVMILAGTTTFGTQGVVEFVCRPDSVAKLMQEIPGAKSGMKPFEALVRVKIARGVPLETELIAVRPR
ncbi:MAG: hypothetical protein WA609_16155 [Terriglobales bacterium]